MTKLKLMGVLVSIEALVGAGGVVAYAQNARAQTSQSSQSVQQPLFSASVPGMENENESGNLPESEKSKSSVQSITPSVSEQSNENESATEVQSASGTQSIAAPAQVEDNQGESGRGNQSESEHSNGPSNSAQSRDNSASEVENGD